MVSSLKNDLVYQCNQFTQNIRFSEENDVLKKGKKLYDQIGKLIFNDSSALPSKRILNELKKYESQLNVVKNKSTCVNLLNP